MEMANHEIARKTWCERMGKEGLIAGHDTNLCKMFKIPNLNRRMDKGQEIVLCLWTENFDNVTILLVADV